MVSAVNAITGVRRPVAFASTQLGGRREAVHDRHAAIHEHDIVGAACKHLERVAAIVRGVHFQAQRFEHAFGDIAIQRLIFDHEHACARGQRGRRCWMRTCLRGVARRVAGQRAMQLREAHGLRDLRIEPLHVWGLRLREIDEARQANDSRSHRAFGEHALQLSGHRTFEQGIVDDDGVVRSGTQLAQYFRQRTDIHRMRAPLIQRLRNEATHRCIVVRDQNAQADEIGGLRRALAPTASASCSDSSTLNVEPAPGVLTNDSCPPINSTSWRAIASPSPVPP